METQTLTTKETELAKLKAELADYQELKNVIVTRYYAGCYEEADEQDIRYHISSFRTEIKRLKRAIEKKTKEIQTLKK